MIALEMMHPLGSRVVLKRLPENPEIQVELPEHSRRPFSGGAESGRAAERTKGGLWIPQTAQQPSHRGVVYRRGKKATAVEVGDVVHYQSSDRDFGDFILIQEADILFVERPDTA